MCFLLGAKPPAPGMVLEGNPRMKGGILWLSPSLPDLRFILFSGAEPRAPGMALERNRKSKGGTLWYSPPFPDFATCSIFGRETSCARYGFGR